MKQIISIILGMFLLYILMLSWNDVMYKQFPSVVIHNYWLFIVGIAVGFLFVKLLKQLLD
jgi:hypothetical protein